MVRALIALGIEPVAGCFWFTPILTENDKQEWVIEYIEDGVYNEHACLPAWTKEELEVMIGGEYMKPDLQHWEGMGQMEMIRYIHEEKVPDYFIYHLPSKLIKQQKGSNACAILLQFLLENKTINIADCNIRYKTIYGNK